MEDQQPKQQIIKEDPDFRVRTDNCNKELDKLLKKYELALFGMPKFIPQQNSYGFVVISEVIFVSTRAEKKEESKKLSEG